MHAVDWNNKKIQGDVTAKGYEGCFEVNDIHFGLARGISMEPGNIANREVTRPSVSEITLTKKMDSASGPLLQESYSGVEGTEVKIYILQTSEKEVQKFAEIILTDCMISSYSISSSVGSPPCETISLSFAAFEADFSHTDKSHKNKAQVRVGYNLATAAPI